MSVRIMSLRLNRLLLYAFGVLAALILLLLLLLKIFGGGSTPAQAKYYPGTYTTSVPLGTGNIMVEMVFSENGIEKINYEIPEAVQKVYPLVQPTAASIGDQLAEGTALEAVQIDSSSSVTASHLLNAMKLTMEKAKAE